jgi:hypothetical protein
MNETTPPALPPPPQTSRLAISSLVLGILSLLCCYVFGGIPSVICGHMAKSRIRRSGGTLGGDGLATAGLITGYLGIALSVFVLPLLLAIAIPNFVKARETAQRNQCLVNLRLIDGAKQQWAEENKKTASEVPTSTDLNGHLPGGFEALHCPQGGIYSINALDKRPTCSISGHQLDANR